MPTLAVYAYVVPTLAVYAYVVPTLTVYAYVVPTLALYAYVVPRSEFPIASGDAARPAHDDKLSQPFAACNLRCQAETGCDREAQDEILPQPVTACQSLLS